MPTRLYGREEDRNVGTLSVVVFQLELDQNLIRSDSLSQKLKAN